MSFVSTYVCEAGCKRCHWVGCEVPTVSQELELMRWLQPLCSAWLQIHAIQLHASTVVKHRSVQIKDQLQTKAWTELMRALILQLDPCKHAPSRPRGLSHTTAVGLAPQATTTRAWPPSKWPSGIAVGVCWGNSINTPIKTRSTSCSSQAAIKIQSFPTPPKKGMHTTENLRRTSTRRRGKEDVLVFFVWLVVVFFTVSFFI